MYFIVHSAHECQVSTGGSRNLSDSEHAALVTNMTSGSGLFSTKNRVKLRTNNNSQDSMGQYVENSFIGTNGVYSSNYNDSEVPNNGFNIKESVQKIHPIVHHTVHVINSK